MLVCGLSLLAGLAGSGADPIRVLLIGDSITSGVVSEPRGDSYALLLAGDLGPGFAVKNVGLAGSSVRTWTGTTPRTPRASMLYRQSVVANLPVRLAVIMLGRMIQQACLSTALRRSMITLFGSAASSIV